MAVSRRLRYEILRRDDHACRYCGQRAPDVPLTVDHVIPVALGGTDEPANLVTACKDCNAGKSASSPDASIVSNVADDALRWAAAMQRAAEIQAQDQQARQAYVDAFGEAWGNYYSLPRDWTMSVGRWYDTGLEINFLFDCIDAAFAARGVEWRWKYFCGVVYRRLTERQQIAQEIIAREDAE
jgi:hypothetical protein